MILTSYSVWRNLRRRSAERICARRRCAHEFGSTRGARRGLSASANSASVVDFDRIVAFAARRCGAARRACRASRAARSVARISCARSPACCSSSQLASRFARWTLRFWPLNASAWPKVKSRSKVVVQVQQRVEEKAVELLVPLVIIESLLKTLSVERIPFHGLTVEKAEKTARTFSLSEQYVKEKRFHAKLLIRY